MPNVKTHLGVLIEVDSAGKFCAEVNDVAIKRTTLRAVEKWIEAQLSGTPCFIDYGLGYTVKRAEITGVERGRFRMRSGDLLERYRGSVYLLVAETADALDALTAEFNLERDKFERSREDLLAKCKRLSPDTFNLDLDANGKA